MNPKSSSLILKSILKTQNKITLLFVDVCNSGCVHVKLFTFENAIKRLVA